MHAHARQPAARPSPSGADVRALVDRAIGGDLAAFEAIYRLHVGRVHAVSLRMAGDASTADDLTQEVFVRAWEQLGSWRGEAAFGTWLHRLAVNVILGDRRAAGRRLARVEPVEDIDGESASGAVDPGIDLQRALDALPIKARQVFVLSQIEGLDHAEIADAMGTSVGTAKSQLHRARDLLRRFFS